MNIRFGNKLFLTLLVVLCPLSLWSQDFRVENFQENTMDMSAATSGVKDLNGNVAALIRFAVRDNKFEFSGNIGVIKTEKKTGEVWLYVPQGTKRLTIKHPVYGVIRGYELPVALQSKTTYDAKITITKVETTKKTGPWFMINAGYNIGGLSGLNFGVGGELGMFYVGADYTIGSGKTEGVAVYYDGNFREAYDYSASRLSLRFGVNTISDGAIRVIPQVGMSISTISGNSIGTAPTEAQFDKAYCTSALIGVSVRAMLGNTFCFYATPEYAFAVASDDVFKTIKEADSSINSWGSGFGLNVGVMLRF